MSLRDADPGRELSATPASGDETQSVTSVHGLDEETVREHLVARRLVDPEAMLDIEPLGGGVSGDVLSVLGQDVRLVVKRPLPRLRVEEEWLADSARVVTEGQALRLAHALTPGVVPRVIDLDGEACILVLEHAPPSWTNWRDDLLAGRIRRDLGRRLGETLATWHEKTRSGASTAPAGFSNLVAFIQLRVAPFYWTAAERHPDLAAEIHGVADELLRSRSCLVHGDFSPKNVLAGAERFWVLDWEVAHVGDPTFDLAYMLTHLALKSAHRPGDAGRYGEVAESFLDAYGGETSRAGTLVANVGCLLLARVDGKSPATYLTPPQQATVRELGRRLLRNPPAHVLELWRGGP